MSTSLSEAILNQQNDFIVSVNPQRMSIPTVAIIGGGAAGLSAARTLLAGGAHVIVLEAAGHVGGNCFGVDVTGADGTVHRVDAGVSDFNRNTFKELTALISELNLETMPICTDLSVTSKSGDSILSSIDGVVECDPVVGDAATLSSEMAAFRLRCPEVVKNSKYSGWTINQYLRYTRASSALRDAFVLPRAMGSFPMPDMAAGYMPVEDIVRFWIAHGIVGARTADRHTVVGGMYRYIEKLEETLLNSGADIRCNTRVNEVSRGNSGVTISTMDSNNKVEVVHADQVLFTVHARTVLPLIADDADATEAHALAGFKIQRPRCVVHHDPSLMARNKEDWGAFNYVAQEGSWPVVRPTITFYPNRLGKLPPGVPDTFVTMNPFHEPRAETIVSDKYLAHPVGIGGEATKKAAEAMDRLQGKRRSWWAGSYLSTPYVHENSWITGRLAAEKMLKECVQVVDNAQMEEDCHEMTITFVDEELVGRSKSKKAFDVTVRLRAPRYLSIRGIRIH